MATDKLKTREEMDPAFTWATEDLYPSDEALEKDLERIKTYVEKLESFQGKLGESADSLLSYLMLKDEISLLLDNAYHYCFLKHDQDTKNPVYQGYHAKAMAILISIESACAFEQPELLSIPLHKIEQFYEENNDLKKYKRYINDILRLKEHVLSPAEEKLLAAAGEIAQSPDLIGGAFRNSDITFPDAVDSNGEKHEVTSGSFIPLMQSDDRNLRISAFQSTYHTFEKFKNTNAAILNAQMKQLKFFSTAYKYKSNLAAALDRTNVPESVYRNLITTVHDNMHHMHKYVSLRKKLLKLDEIHMYDLYTPIVSECDIEIPFEEAKKDVYEAVAPLGKEYQSILQAGFDNRWIDVYENVGKRSGAYSSGAKIHPYVLLNHHNTLDAEFTLAHEMGHALHSYLSNHTQSTVDADYVIFVAEVASTFNENLLMQYKLKKTTEPKQRAYLINYFLEQFRTTLYRQTMFAEFELLINEEVERGGSLTAEFLCNLYHKLNVEYYGPDMIVDPEIDIEWARIPHFYYNYYVYQYATGFSAAVALSQNVLNNGEKELNDYLNFLKGGCSKDPITLLKGAGVDMSSPEPISNALSLFGKMIDELDSLLSE